MKNTTTPSAPSARPITLGDLDQAVSTLNAIAKDAASAAAFRRVVEQCFNPELITLIRDLYADSEIFCDKLRPFFADPE